MTANGYGNTALHEAVQHGGPVALISLLLQSGANVSLRNHKGSEALHFLCYGSNPALQTIEIARELISAGADINSRDNRGATPILVCASSGRYFIYNALSFVKYKFLKLFLLDSILLSL